jgi:hypothetical protein
MPRAMTSVLFEGGLAAAAVPLPVVVVALELLLDVLDEFELLSLLHAARTSTSPSASVPTSLRLRHDLTLTVVPPGLSALGKATPITCR